MNAKSKKIITTIAKILIIVLAYSFATYKIACSPDIKKIPTHLNNITANEYFYLILLIALMPINWLLESIKWQLIIRNIERISLTKSIKAVLTGVTIGTITPNRVGEFAGRILFVSKEKRATATFLTFFGDIAQLCATIIFGMVGLLLIGSEKLFINFYLVLCISISIAIIIFLLYINYEKVILFVQKKKICKKFLANYLYNNDINISRKTKFYTATLSITRYLIFCFQFYCSLRFFGINIGLYEALISIFTTYLCIYIIPNIAIAELGVRTSFAILIIGIFTQNETGIALSSLLLYIVNVAISIGCGGIILFFKKNKKNIVS